jgi:hypothetical protein
MMSHPHPPWWLKYGSVGQIAPAAVALCGFVAVSIQINLVPSSAGTRHWIAAEMQKSGVNAPDCKT